MQVKAHAHTIRTSDVVHIYDEEKNLNWFIVFEKTNGLITDTREAINEELFKWQGGEYMQEVYVLAYKTMNKNVKKRQSPHRTDE